MLFCLDPPHWGSEHYFVRGMFERSQFETPAAVLRGLRGRFVLSINDVPELHKHFARATIEESDHELSGGRSEDRALALIVRSI